MEQPFGCSEDDLAHYICRRATGPIKVDGLLDEPSWQMAERSPRFVDIVTGSPGLYGTRAAALWDEEYLYIGFWIEEPYIQAILTERDSLIWYDNDVEVFIDGGDSYYEFEINALGTIYEVFFIWQDAYTRGSRFDTSEFDLLSRKVRGFIGPWGPNFNWEGRHPRGNRWAFLDWDFPGIQTAVHLDGTLNDNRDVDRGWTVELAFPWRGMTWLANGRSLPPKLGDVWRMFFGRFENMTVNGIKVPTVGWAWNMQGIYEVHLPECFTYIHFSEETVG